MPHILIICTANICRSPVVEALLRQKLALDGRSHWTVSSAGTWAKVKRGPSRHSRRLMAAQGLDISQHRAQMVTTAMLEAADLILCMETGHLEALQIEFPEYSQKMLLFSEITGKRFSVEDPYGGSLKAYRKMVEQVTDVLDEGYGRLITLVEAQIE